MATIDKMMGERMRKRADWMKPVDDLVLEFLRDEGAATPKRLADVFDKNNDYIGVRCRELMAYGLVDRPARGLYTITEIGEGYLDEDVDASDLDSGD